MYMVTCSQHGLKHLNNGLQWVHDKNEAVRIMEDHRAKYAERYTT